MMAEREREKEKKGYTSSIIIIIMFIWRIRQVQNEKGVHSKMDELKIYIFSFGEKGKREEKNQDSGKENKTKAL